MSETAWFPDGLRGRHVLFGLIGFFAFVFLVNGVFIYYALTTFGGGDTSDPYRKGLHYNDTLAEAARDAERGWLAKLNYGPSSGWLALSLTDKEGRPVPGLHLNGTVSRPVTDRQDVAASFKETESGIYAATMRLAPGQWIVQLQAEELSRAGDPMFRLKQRLLIPETP